MEDELFVKSKAKAEDKARAEISRRLKSLISEERDMMERMNENYSRGDNVIRETISEMSLRSDLSEVKNKILALESFLSSTAKEKISEEEITNFLSLYYKDELKSKSMMVCSSRYLQVTSYLQECSFEHEVEELRDLLRNAASFGSF